MLEQSVITAIAAIGTIIVALIGVFKLIKGFIDEKKQNRLVKYSIYYEIQQNLKMICELWNDLNTTDNIYVFKSRPWIMLMENNDERKVILADKLINLGLPKWRDEDWKIQHSLSIALKRDEIIAVNNFYASLYDINSIHDSILSISKKDDEDYKIHQNNPKKKIEESMSFYSIFCRDAPLEWNKFEKIILNLIKNGNPLKIPQK